MTIALFDFDGTITTKDSLAEFIKFAVGKQDYYLGLLKISPILMAYILKIIPNYRAKEKMISHFFKGYPSDTFNEIAQIYSLNEIDKIVRTQAIEKIQWHKNNGHKVVIVSASMENWLVAWCKQHELELIATGLEIKDSKLTGKFSTKNCYGKEKLRRVQKKYDLSDFDEIYAYGDSSGDKNLLEVANHSFYKPFRT